LKSVESRFFIKENDKGMYRVQGQARRRSIQMQEKPGYADVQEVPGKGIAMCEQQEG
jgi:hypothetical protein